MIGGEAESGHLDCWVNGSVQQTRSEVLLMNISRDRAAKPQWTAWQQNSHVAKAHP